MSIATREVTLTLPGAQDLRAVIDLPEGPVEAVALFAHCLACAGESVAPLRVGRALADEGFVVLRVDVPGLADPRPDASALRSRADALLAGAALLRAEYRAPELLIGHGDGAAALLVAAGALPERRALVTIGAPLDHVEQLASVPLSALGTPVLVLHSPTDEVVGIDHARRLFEAVKHPKSFVSLDGADHRLLARRDAVFVARLIASWAARYVVAAPEEPPPSHDSHRVVVAETHEGQFTQSLLLGQHRFRADEPVALGGQGNGPSPYELLLGALGACTSMTLRMYANMKKLALSGVRVELRHQKIYAKDCADCETREGKIDVIERVIELEGELSPEQRQRLLEIANKCPVHKTLLSEVKISSRLAD